MSHRSLVRVVVMKQAGGGEDGGLVELGHTLSAAQPGGPVVGQLCDCQNESEHPPLIL